MISKDMKYTALYWALRFVENQLDVHENRITVIKLRFTRKNITSISAKKSKTDVDLS